MALCSNWFYYYAVVRICVCMVCAGKTNQYVKTGLDSDTAIFDFYVGNDIFLHWWNDCRIYWWKNTNEIEILRTKIKQIKLITQILKNIYKWKVFVNFIRRAIINWRSTWYVLWNNSFLLFSRFQFVETPYGSLCYHAWRSKSWETAGGRGSG